jgi:myo-inositol 2-dehydrogenase / D-chiro-inositol 1-dehydrogenase
MATALNVGIIGAGRIGRVHGENLAFRIPQAKVVAIADICEEAAQACAREFAIPSVYTDPRQVIDRKDVEAIIICSNTASHCGLIEESAAAGKHIFCEKPIDLDLKRIDHALAAVQGAGVKLQIGFNRRFDPSFRKVHDSVSAGLVGTPQLVRISSRDPEPPSIEYVKSSGGIFLDMTIHDFDIARFLVEDEVDEIFAKGGVMVDPAIGQAGDIDTAVIVLHYRSGAIGAIDNSRRSVYGYDQRIEVFGSQGAVSAGNNKPDSTEISTAQSISTSLPLFFFVERYKEAYVEEMKAFIAAIKENKTPPVTGVDGRNAVVMGYAAKKSYAEKRPVKLQEIDPHWNR